MKNERNAASGHSRQTLNKNDAKEARYWDVEVVQEANYDFVFHFRKPLKNSGNMTLRMGTVKRTVHNEIDMGEDTREVTISNIPLEEGEYKLNSWYSSQGRQTPFYVEIIRK